jgi:hypothetical protein
LPKTRDALHGHRLDREPCDLEQRVGLAAALGAQLALQRPLSRTLKKSLALGDEG